MKRFALKLALFLLLGAIINVLVAWGCLHIPGRYFTDRSLTKTEIAWLQSHGERLWDGWQRRSIGMSTLHIRLNDSDFETRRNDVLLSGGPIIPTTPYYFRRVSIGWPALALSDESWRHSKDWSQRNSFRRTEEIAPWRPIWPGFAINTIFYAAILWLPFVALGRIRRRRRIKRGWCVGCGYDLRGNQNEICPECGASASKSA